MNPTEYFSLQDYSTHTLRQVAERAQAEWLLIQIAAGDIELLPHGTERFVDVGRSTGAALIYSDYYTVDSEVDTQISNIDYQRGALRDDFDFGALVMLKTDIFKSIVARAAADYAFAGWYDLRLRISEEAEIFHIPEPLYSVKQTSSDDAHSRHFAYIDKKNVDVQLDMERACTAHLERIGGLLTTTPKKVDIDEGNFAVEASVVIPVRNRENTIADAVRSALSQVADFEYNVVVVDNHSTDRTGQIVEELAKANANVIRITPESRHLGIGGCWQLATDDTRCGRFAVQLDSDDVYQSPHTLQTIVDEFRRRRCAMVIGAYTITDFEMNPIAPFLVDHREWTEKNGRNNALRINGLGAPRAFYTPIVRQINFPNVSYGEDYAMGLRICREWEIGRIYSSLYLCRRWGGNSDSGISRDTQNRYNFYKDKLRTIELISRTNKK